MSRSDYTDDCEDNWAMIRYRGAVNSATKGKRGQQLFRDLAAALDAMPVKSLTADELVTQDGEYCTLGVLGAARGMDIAKLDPEDHQQVAAAFNVADCLVREIVFENDDEWSFRSAETPEHRWTRMRKWVEQQIIKAPK